MDAKTVEHTFRFLGETLGFWIQTGALFASAIAAIWLIYTSSESEKHRATIDLVISQKQDQELQVAKKHVLNLHETQVKNFAKYLEDRNSEDFKQIIRVLNNYEFIAVGIHKKAFDEELFKRMQYSVLIKDWDALCPLVMELRRQNERSTLFQEFEILAKQWKKNPLKTEDSI